GFEDKQPRTLATVTGLVVVDALDEPCLRKRRKVRTWYVDYGSVVVDAARYAEIGDGLIGSECVEHASSATLGVGVLLRVLTRVIYRARDYISIVSDLEDHFIRVDRDLRWVGGFKRVLEDGCRNDSPEYVLESVG